MLARPILSASSLARSFCFLALGLAATAAASPLFNSDEELHVTLAGPLTTLLRHKQRDTVYPFEISTPELALDVEVRVRGKSRRKMCRFPPLRLDFDAGDTGDSVFASQEKLKLVTHCRSDNPHAENSVLNEYLAYRILNLITPQSYRVRLLRIRYEDTLDKQKDLDRSYYGFLIESDKELAARLGGKKVKLDGVVFSRLDQTQLALVNVFQYLIGNRDWSLVKSDSANACCHNLRLVESDDRLTAIPYDFDLAGLVDAAYPARYRQNLNRFVGREYRGYCRSSIDTVGQALSAIRALEPDIVSLAQLVPAIDPNHATKRTRFLQDFFDEAASEQELLDRFEKSCIGERKP